MADKRNNERADDNAPKDENNESKTTRLTSDDVSRSSRQEQEEDAMAALMTDIALKDDAKSASASQIQDDVIKTLHNIEEETHRHRGSVTATGGAPASEAKNSESDVVVVMNVALKVEGVTKKQFHQMDPEKRSRLMSHLIDTNISANASCDPSQTPSSAENSRFESEGQEDGATNELADEELQARAGPSSKDSLEGVGPKNASSFGSTSRSFELVNDTEAAQQQKNANAESDDYDSSSNGNDGRDGRSDDGSDGNGFDRSDGASETGTGAGRDGVSDTGIGGGRDGGSDTGIGGGREGWIGRNRNAEDDEEGDGTSEPGTESEEAGREGGITGYKEKSLVLSTNADDDGEGDDGEGNDEDGANGEEEEAGRVFGGGGGGGGLDGSNLSIPTDPKKAAELVGSLIGMENAINRELAYDASKLVAFPPLWVSPGAKIVRQHEAELNWKDRMQDWETQKPERPTIYKIAIRDNLLRLGKKCYGCTDHGYRPTCLGYVEKVTEPSDYAHYDDIPTPEEYPVFGKGLVPRKQAQDIQAQRAKQRYQPFGLKDIYQKNQFVLGKNVPYYCRKQKPPKGHPQQKLPPIGKRIAKNMQDEKAHHKASVMGGKTRIDDLARPHQYNTCKSYFPKEYITAFQNPKDQICFKDVAMFMPAEERDKVNKTEDMWPKSAREKKKGKKREAEL